MKDTNEENTFYLIPKRFIDSRIHQNKTFLESTERSGKKEDAEIYMELLALLQDIQGASRTVEVEKKGFIVVSEETLNERIKEYEDYAAKATRENVPKARIEFMARVAALQEVKDLAEEREDDGTCNN